MDLFDFNNNEETAKPLAERMRANNLDEFIGQKHIVSEHSLLRRAIATDKLGSCIFWGPPGCGKTTLANIIALRTNGEFIKLNAVNSGVADVKKAVDTARNNLKMYGKRTYLMLDECHRFNKTQSDSLLPAIEQGTIIFIGSTTENPYASMTPAIVSRCRVFEFKRLTEEDISGALYAALKNRHKGLGKMNVEADEEAIAHIARKQHGFAGRFHLIHYTRIVAVVAVLFGVPGVVKDFHCNVFAQLILVLIVRRYYVFNFLRIVFD